MSLFLDDAVKCAVNLLIVAVIARDGLPLPARYAISLTVRPVMYTVKPASQSSMAIPFPMPRLAPVTTATRLGIKHLFQIKESSVPGFPFYSPIVDEPAGAEAPRC
jgi:hypothetical protein